MRHVSLHANSVSRRIPHLSVGGAAGYGYTFTMRTRFVIMMFFASSLTLNACATVVSMNNSGMQTMQTEEGDTVQVVRGVSMADPAPLQCQPGHVRRDLVCQPAATDHLYASVMGFDAAPNTNVAEAPHSTMQCDVSQSDSQSCLDGSRLLTGERPEPAFLVSKPFEAENVKAIISQALFFTARSDGPGLSGQP